MDDGQDKQGHVVSAPARDFAAGIDAKARRKRKAQRHGAAGAWFGLGMMGLIGWSIVVPTLLGAALGTWLDNRYHASHSWTLALVVGGLTLGCFNAWHWVAQQDKAMRDEEADDGPT